MGSLGMEQQRQLLALLKRVHGKADYIAQAKQLDIRAANPRQLERDAQKAAHYLREVGLAPRAIRLTKSVGELVMDLTDEWLRRTCAGASPEELSTYVKLFGLFPQATNNPDLDAEIRATKFAMLVHRAARLRDYIDELQRALPIAQTAPAATQRKSAAKKPRAKNRKPETG